MNDSLFVLIVAYPLCARNPLWLATFFLAGFDTILRRKAPNPRKSIIPKVSWVEKVRGVLVV